MALRKVVSPSYNLIFDSTTGFTARWGKTEDEDPVMSPFGPEIADIEISTICGKGCSACYKGNTSHGKNMSLDTFKIVLSKFPKLIMQIAFGIGDIDANPDLYPIFEHCRANDVVPNVTINGANFSDYHAERLASLCGAVAVSHYNDKDCFSAIEKLHHFGLRQVNIHQILSDQTYNSCFDLINKAKNITGLQAIVFLLLKPKGSRNIFTPVKELDKFEKLFTHAKDNDVAIGMDSCSAPMALKTLPDSKLFIEPCESGLFSVYVSVSGTIFPCSFSEGVGDWVTGIDLHNVNDFLKDVWFSEKMNTWRERLLGSSKGCSNCSVCNSCRSCPLYDITVCKQD